jgi:hypothetical protein
MARKFEIYRAALGSRARTYMVNVYDLNPASLGTFDLVMFFGVLYHLRHPILALQKVASVCTGTVLMQTATCDNTSNKALAEFHPFGIKSGPPTIPAKLRSHLLLVSKYCMLQSLVAARWISGRRANLERRSCGRSVSRPVGAAAERHPAVRNEGPLVLSKRLESRVLATGLPDISAHFPRSHFGILCRPCGKVEFR